MSSFLLSDSKIGVTPPCVGKWAMFERVYERKRAKAVRARRRAA